MILAYETRHRRDHVLYCTAANWNSSKPSGGELANDSAQTTGAEIGAFLNFKRPSRSPRGVPSTPPPSVSRPAQ